MKTIWSIFICMLLLPLTEVNAQNRNIIWVHGLGSENEAWQQYATSFHNQRRFVVTDNRDYNTNMNGVVTMANEVVNRTGGVGGAQTIGIGHSLGAIALREIDARTRPGHIGGYITMGGPLNGARILNALQNGESRAYISSGVNELLKGPLRELLGANYIIVRVGVRIFTGRKLQEVIVDESGFDELAMGLVQGPSIRDLSEGSAYMTTAQFYTTTTPKISIYGNENSPVHYRLASSFSDNADSDLPNVINKAKGVYNAFYIKNLAFLGILNAYRASGWKAGRDYLKEQSEKGWNNLIGATRTESSTSCVRTLICGYDYYYGYCSELGLRDPVAGQRCRDDCWQEQCTTYSTYYNQPSDGLLHQSTQLGQSTRSTGSQWNPNATFEALGANHSEYNEHAGTRQRLERIFNGLDNVPTFFVTPLR